MFNTPCISIEMTLLAAVAEPATVNVSPVVVEAVSMDQTLPEEFDP